MNQERSATANKVAARTALRRFVQVDWQRPVRLAVGVAVAAGLAACAASHSSQSSAAGGNAPITIMNIGDYTTPPYNFPEGRTGALAAVTRINQAGGLNGHQLKLLTCDDLGNPNGAAACARQAVTAKVAAAVGTFTLFGDSVVQLLQQAGIPDIFPTADSALEGSSKVSFPVITTGASSSALLKALVDTGCKSVAVLSPDLASGRSNVANYMSPAAKNLGVKLIPGYVSLTATNLSPIVSQMLSAGADCFEWGLGPQQVSAGLLALQQAGSHARSVTAITLMPQSLLGQLRNKGTGLLVVSNYYYPSTGRPVAVQAGNDIKAADQKAPIDEASLNAYAAVLAFAKAATGLKDVNSATVLGALSSMKTLNIGLLPPIDLNGTGFIKSIPRGAATLFPVYVARGGTYVPASPDEVDIAHLFN